MDSRQDVGVPREPDEENLAELGIRPFLLFSWLHT